MNTGFYDIEKISKDILKLFDSIEWHLEKDEDHISMTYPNKNNPRFPLSVTVYVEEGICVDLGGCDVMEGSSDVSEVTEIIKDILDDRLAVAVAYPDEASFEKQIRPLMMRTFEFEDENDLSCFERFVNKVSKPRSFLDRLNVFVFHGVIEISDWSGSKYHKIYRK